MGENKLKDLKFTHKADAIAARLEISGIPLYYLVPVGSWILENESHIQLLTSWRQVNRDMYFARFPETLESMIRYLEDISIADQTTLLFIIEDQNGIAHGHIGIKGFTDRTVEIDSVMRGNDVYVPGLMDAALVTLMEYCEQELGVGKFILEVISYNRRAIDLYTRNGFSVCETRSLFQSKDGEIVSHVYAPPEDSNVDYRSLKFVRYSKGASR